MTKSVNELDAGKSDSLKPKVLVLSIHRAPYRDPVFRLVHSRGVIEIEVATMFPEDIGHPFWELRGPEYPNLDLGANWMLSKKHAFHPRVIGLLRRRGFDVVLIPGMNHFTSLICILYCLMNKIPFLLNFDSIGPRKKGFNTIVRLKHVLIRKASGIWVPGGASREYFEWIGIAPSRVFEGAYTLDEHSIGEQLTQASLKRNALLERFGIPRDGLNLLMVANLLPNRAHMFLLEVLFRIVSIHPQTKLVIVGDGPERERIDRAIQTMNLKTVYLIPPVPFTSLAEIYSISDIYVHTGKEPYSTAISYAAIAGLPIVTTISVGASSDYVVNGITGLLIEQKVESWVEALSLLLSNPTIRRMMGKEALRVAQARGLVWAATQLELATFSTAKPPLLD